MSDNYDDADDDAGMEYGLTEEIRPFLMSAGTGSSFFTVVFVISQIGYYFTFGIALKWRRTNSNNNNRGLEGNVSSSSSSSYRFDDLTSCLLPLGLITVGFPSLLYSMTSIMGPKREQDPKKLAIQAVGIAIALEVLQSCRYSTNQNKQDSKLYRLAFFCLWLGSSCFTSYYVLHQQVLNQYEYYGPMRVMNYTLHKMDRLFYAEVEAFPSCLPQDIVPNDQYGVITPTLTIGWGKDWGCRTATDRWNTNWPTLSECIKLICKDTSKGTSSSKNSCECYQEEESARNASLSCLEEIFDLSKIHKNNNNNATFDLDQPPWEDPSWPSIIKYGSCDPKWNVGLSYDVAYIDHIRKNSQEMKLWGIYFTVLGFNLMIVLLYGCCFSSNREPRRPESNEYDGVPLQEIDPRSPSHSIWNKLKNARNQSQGEMITIASRAKERGDD